VGKNNTKKYLVCKRVKFHFAKDEDAFFWWLKRIPCIEKIDAVRDELYLHLVKRPLIDQDLRDLIGLFYRYKIDMKQLAQFLTKKNKKWFFDNPKGFWHRRVFGRKPNE
jgi:hypothetical protein